MDVVFRSVLCFVLVILIPSTFQLSSYVRSQESNSVSNSANPMFDGNSEYGDAPSITNLFQAFLETNGGKQIGGFFLQQSIKNPDMLSNLGKIVTNMGGSLMDELGKGSVGSFENEVEPHDPTNARWDSVLNIVSGYLNSPHDGVGLTMDRVFGYLPVLLKSMTGGHLHYEDKELEDEEEHKKDQQEVTFLPPYMQFFKYYWEHFKKSELGQMLWGNSHLRSLFQTFVDKDGYFQIDRIFDSIEDHSFRRRWITSLTTFVAQWVKYIAQPATLKRYMNTVQFVGNSFLQSQGYPKTAYFDPNKPASSLSFLVNAIFSRHFGLQVNSAKYIRPAVTYVQDLVRMAKDKGVTLSQLSDKDIERRLAETLNGEVIEPVLRVWRAYRYSIKHPECDRYLICSVSRLEPNDHGLTGMKPGIIKLSSLIGSWFLSGRTGTPFWKFYYAATENYVCEKKFNVYCRGFHEEENAAIEYRHNEL